MQTLCHGIMEIISPPAAWVRSSPASTTPPDFGYRSVFSARPGLSGRIYVSHRSTWFWTAGRQAALADRLKLRREIIPHSREIVAKIDKPVPIGGKCRHSKVRGQTASRGQRSPVIARNRPDLASPAVPSGDPTRVRRYSELSGQAAIVSDYRGEMLCANLPANDPFALRRIDILPGRCRPARATFRTIRAGTTPNWSTCPVSVEMKSAVV